MFATGVWDGLKDESSTPGDRLVFGVEIAGNRESASIASISYRADGVVHVEVIENRLGTSWLGPRLAELQAKWNPAAIVSISGGHVDSLLLEWKKLGVRVRLLKFADYVAGCGVVYDLITQGGLRHLGDEVLTAAVNGVQKAFGRDNTSFYWSRKGSDVDITPLVAVTVGVSVLDKRAALPGGANERRKSVIL